MPEAAEIRTAIKSVIDGVSDIGVVHAYERYADNKSEFKTLYMQEISSVNQVRGWFIRRMTRKESSEYEGRTKVIMSWRIQGYMGFVDADESELAFDALLDALVAAFRSDDTLGGVVDSTIVGQDAGLQLEDSGPVLFAGVLCHSARGRLMTQHFI